MDNKFYKISQTDFDALIKIPGARNILTHAEIVDVKEEVFENTKGEICARVTIECIEDIGTELPIDAGSYNMERYLPEDEHASSTKEQS